MDPSVVAVLSALVGSVVGAAGTYLASVGAERAQGKRRIAAVLRALEPRIQTELENLPAHLERTRTLFNDLARLAGVLNALRQDDPQGDTVRVRGETFDATDPEVCARLLRATLSAGLTTPDFGTWTPLILPDLEHVAPRTFSLVADLETAAQYLARWIEHAIATSNRFLEHIEYGVTRDTLRGLGELNATSNGALERAVWAHHLAIGSYLEQYAGYKAASKPARHVARLSG